jgi:hypothetical protein
MEAKEEAMRLERMFADNNRQGGARRPQFAEGEPPNYVQQDGPQMRY